MDLHPIDVCLSSACDAIVGADSTSGVNSRLAGRRAHVEIRNAADLSGRRRCSRIALSFAVVGGTRRECLTLPDGALISRAAEGARRAAEACESLGLRATFLVPGAHITHHVKLLHTLVSRHEIGLYGFDPVRPAPDDPFRGREALTVALGCEARWYCPRLRRANRRVGNRARRTSVRSAGWLGSTRRREISAGVVPPATNTARTKPLAHTHGCGASACANGARNERYKRYKRAPRPCRTPCPLQRGRD